MKDWFYDRIVRRNERIQKEYERYVRGHLEEHKKKRWKHWLVLLGLSWKYRNSQKNRIHTFVLVKQKKDSAKVRMEWVPGAVCYNIYLSTDGVKYHFLQKEKHHVCTLQGMGNGKMYFLKYKVSLDGRFYSEFSEVLTVSAVQNKELYFMEQLSQKLEKENGSSDMKGKNRNQNTAAGIMTVEAKQGEGIRISWKRASGAIHYNLYRAEEGKPYIFLIQTEKDSYMDEKIIGGISYEYKLKYTGDGKKYHDYSIPVSVTAPAEKYRGGNSGPLPEKGAESAGDGRISFMHLAKGMMPYEVISFDVFDTLIFRPFEHPYDLFVLEGEELDIMDFCEIRRSAEEEARQNSRLKRGNREVTLEEIYDLVADETGIDPKEGAALEFSMECRLCYGNPYMLEVFHILKEQGKILVALSDMYLSAAKMEKLLSCCGYEGFDEIIVSCDYNCSKRDGGLYDVLKKKYAGRTIVHVGDHPVSDLESARKKGIDARFYQNVNEAGRRYRAKDMSYLAESAYRGIVNAWLHSGRRSFTPYYEVGFVYTGFYCMGFCQWIARYVREHELEKVLFLAREGDIYQKVFQEMYPDIPTEYVLWSRIPVVKTTVRKNRHPYLLQIVHHKANALYKSMIGTLLERTGIGRLKAYLPDYRLKEEEFLTPGNEKVLRELLLDHWDEVCSCYEADDTYIRSYLERKIQNAKKAAVVDVGWSGNNVLQVKYLVEEAYGMDCRIHCLLAAARNVNDTYMAGMMQRKRVETYIFSNMYNKGLHDTHQEENKKLNSFFFEILTQSSTPTFLGFDQQGKFLYDIPEVENYRHNREIHQGTLDFVKEYKKRFRDFPFMLDISGHDAYMPFQYFSRNLLWLKKYFGNYIFGRDLFATGEEAVMESVSEVMKKAGLWEEGS